MTRIGSAVKALCVSAVVLTALVSAGCGASSTSSSSGPTAPPQTGITPTPVPAATSVANSVTWILHGGEPSSLDWRYVFSSSDLLVAGNLCEGLMKLQPDGSAAPNLATAIDQPNPTTYVVHLRPNVVFSDGSPMTAQDVAYSLTAITDPNAGSFFGGTYGAGAKVTVTNATTVTIKLPAVNSMFLNALTTPLGWVVEKSYVEAAGSKYGTPSKGVMCTGAYTLDKWTPGSGITLKPNPKWWGAASHKRWNKSVNFIFVADQPAIASALLSGDADGSYYITGEIYDKLETSGQGNLYTGPSTNGLALMVTNYTGGLKNLKMRQALAKLVDYQGIIKTQYGPTAEPAHALMPPGSWGYASNIFSKAYNALPEPTQDIAGAKKLAQEAGNPPVKLAAPSIGGVYSAVANQIASAAKQAGMNVTVTTVPMSEYYELYTATGAQKSGYDATVADSLADFPDPLSFYSALGTPTAALNVGGYNNPKLTSLTKQALAATDDTKRANLVVQMQNILTKNLVWVQLFYVKQSAFMNSSTTGAPIALPLPYYTPWALGLGSR